MQHKFLQNNKLQVSPLGFGSWAIGGEMMMRGVQAGWGEVDDAESIRAIHAALAGGITLIDTAANYGTGHSEEIIAQAIQGRREEVVLATKFGFNVDEAAKTVDLQTPDAIIENINSECERSLRHLHTDVIDIYQFHMWDFPPERVPELIDKLESLITQGKIRSYGWSTDNIELAHLFATQDNCTTIQHEANVMQPAAEMFALTAETDVVSLIRSPLMMGFLSDKYDNNSVFTDTDIRSHWFKPEQIAKIVSNRGKIREILASNGRSTVQGALAWLWATGDQVVPIPGIRTEAQAIENAAAMEFGPLTAEQMTEIEQLLGREEIVTT